MPKRRRVLRLVLGLTAVAAIPGGFFGFIWAASAGSDQGSAALASEWKAALLADAEPDDAAARDPDVVVLRFADGDWAFGKSQDSHGVWRRGGGTAVVRDSRGRVRAFFGHVCGPRYLSFGSDLPSLDAFYEQLRKQLRTEYQFPGAAEPVGAPDMGRMKD
jgi:hypothetical protein